MLLYELTSNRVLFLSKDIAGIIENILVSVSSNNNTLIDEAKSETRRNVSIDGEGNLN